MKFIHPIQDELIINQISQVAINSGFDPSKQSFNLLDPVQWQIQDFIKEWCSPEVFEANSHVRVSLPEERNSQCKCQMVHSEANFDHKLDL